MVCHLGMSRVIQIVTKYFQQYMHDHTVVLIAYTTISNNKYFSP